MITFKLIPRKGIVLSQNFYGLDKEFIRKNADVFILFSQPQRSLTAILQDIDHGMERMSLNN